MSTSPPPPPPPQPASPPPSGDGPGSGGGPGQAWSALSRGWKIGMGVIGAVVILAIIGLAAGADESGTTTVTETVTEAAAPAEPRTVTETVTRTRTVRAPAPAAGGGGGGGGGGGQALSYEGNGSRNLGTVTVARDSTLRWTNDGPLFQIFDDNFGLTLSSQAGSGETFVAAGSYPSVTVNAVGSWSIRITPN